ncbi:MAG: thioester reductase domain-containing protein, partial [Cyanobacteria bacterium P01_F01_bin.86]
HADALKNPAMMGGPFIHHAASRVPPIEALLAKTRIEQARLLALSEAIATLETLLVNHPAGASLEPLYAQVPAALQGYVELVYDAQHRPSMRLIEGLLYRSEYYDDARQSMALQLGDSDARSFVLSTPRLPESTSLHIPLPFRDHRWDQLFAMRHTPQSVQAMMAAFAIAPDQAAAFRKLFTATPPRQSQPYRGDGVRIRYFGHACVLIETEDVSILVDPLISYDLSDDNPEAMPRYSYADLPTTIDYALITHNHQDHVMLETLMQIRHKIRHLIVPQSQKGSLVDPSLKLILKQIGFDQVQTLDELETIPLPDGEIISIPVLGEHGDLNIATKTAYWVQLKGRSILCAADSNNLDPQLYNHVHHLLGSLDILFIGMECDGAPYTWAYGPLLTQPVPHSLAQTRRLDGSNADRAIALVNQLHPQHVYIYAMGQEPWLTFITSINYTPDSTPIQESSQLVAYCQQQGMVSDRLLGRKEIELTAKARTEWKQERIPVTVGNREQGVGNREQGVGNREQGVGNREQGVGNREQEAARRQELGARGQESGVRSQESGVRSRFKTQNSKLKTQNSEFRRASLFPQGTPNSELNTLLKSLNDRDIRLWLEGETLRCNAPKGAMTAAIKQQLKAYKPEIVALLNGEAVRPTSQSAEQEDWAMDRVLPEAICPVGGLEDTHLTQAPKRILLTGATGFLGAFLLNELLRQTEAEIVCLVRAESEVAGRQRLETIRRGYGMGLDSGSDRSYAPEQANRIVPLPGNLAEPNLGLAEATFNELADSIDAIYHNGAWVHHVSPYGLLRETNVLGTREILRLACQQRPKPLHFTSTLSVLPLTPLPDQVKLLETDALERYPVPAGGYNRTKWVAEQLVAQARDRGLPVTIYRPGPISGHSQTGAFNTNDFLYRLMQGYVQLGTAPQGEMPLDILPVDYVSRTIVHLSLRPASLGKVFHLIHPQPVSSDVLFAACHAAGHPIQRVPYDYWHTQLMEIAQGAKDHPLYPLVSLFASRRDATTDTSTDVLDVPFDCQNTLNGLADAAISCPPLNKALFRTYLEALKASGAIAAPAVSMGDDRAYISTS